MVLRALDLALCIRITRAADRFLSGRGHPDVQLGTMQLAYALRSKLTERIRNEDPLVLKVGAALAGGAGEYSALINNILRRHE
jgi:hypothetical protein